MKINITRKSIISRSIRCQQLEAMFDVPPSESSVLTWSGDIPIEDGKWQVGLIVGPSGSGKSTIGQELFKENYHIDLKWGKPSVIDDFADGLTIKDIAKACSTVGFNTIPAWLRPYAVLSTGEKFRVDIARRLLELSDPIVIDEFTSVVDRQVAKIGAHAVQNYIRKNNRRFVAISCHYDIIDWLMPDWIVEPTNMEFRKWGESAKEKKSFGGFEMQVEV